MYENFASEWVTINTDNGIVANREVVVEANTEIPLLGTFLGGGISNWTYKMIAEQVGEFHCGAANTNPNNKGTTMTVELRLTNPADPSDYKIVAVCTHTFQ